MRKPAYNKHHWSEYETQFMRDNYASMTNREIAKALGLTLTLTRMRLYELGLKRMELEYWTDEQIKFLLDNYRTIGDVEIAEIFSTKWPKAKGWTKKHIEKKRKYLKIKRSKDELKAIHQRNVDNGRFLVCVLKRWETTGVAAEGDIRYWRCQNGRMIPRIKVNGKFIHYARWRYQQLHGEIPQGMNVVFKDDNPRNLDDNNLVLFTNSELSDNNSIKSSKGLSDNYVAGMLTHGDVEARKIIKEQMPELIEIKRQQLLLDRQIRKKQL